MSDDVVKRLDAMLGKHRVKFAPGSDDDLPVLTEVIDMADPGRLAGVPMNDNTPATAENAFDAIATELKADLLAELRAELRAEQATRLGTELRGELSTRLAARIDRLVQEHLAAELPRLVDAALHELLARGEETPDSTDPTDPHSYPRATDAAPR